MKGGDSKKSLKEGFNGHSKKSNHNRSTRLLQKQTTEELDNDLHYDPEDGIGLQTVQRADHNPKEPEVSINNENQFFERESNASVLDQIHSIQGSVYQI